jgi:transposase
VSLPSFSTQAELFSTAGLTSNLFAPTDRYRLFGQVVYPALAGMRGELEKCYCPDNGRVAIEPVLMMGVSLLQYLDGLPDRQAVEMLRYHAGWSFALNRQLGDELFHPTSLSTFRQRLIDNGQSALGFRKILDALVEAGLVSRQSRQRLDSTQIFGLVSRMGRLDCVRETLRLALKELAGMTPSQERPKFWAALWERSVDSQVDYRTSAETLGRKMAEAGSDCWLVLEWLSGPGQAQRAAGEQAKLLKRVFGEQFEVVAGSPTPLSKEKTAVVADSAVGASEKAQGTDEGMAPGTDLGLAEGVNPNQPVSPDQLELSAPVMMTAPVEIRKKGKGELDSDRVQNPHDPSATYGVKGEGDKKKEHVGFKIQVAETVTQAELAPGEPTRNFLTGMVTQPAHESDEEGAEKMAAEQAEMGLEKPPVQYVDGAYVSGEKLAEAQAEGRVLMGPAQPAPQNKEGRYTTADFDIRVEERKAICPAGQASTQCSRLEDQKSGRVNYRFEWSWQCENCPLRGKCVAPEQKHRTILVGEYHTPLQARRKEQKTEAFAEEMKNRNGIEGTQSELVRAHGMRRARYRGLPKVGLQNYLAGMACNVKRWLNRKAWELLRAEAERMPAAG